METNYTHDCFPSLSTDWTVIIPDAAHSANIAATTILGLTVDTPFAIIAFPAFTLSRVAGSVNKGAFFFITF